MRAFVFPLGLLLLATFVNAQYFSEGWTPGQPVAQTQDAPPAATSVPPEQKERERISPSTILKMLDFNYLITSAPSVALFAQFGINITEKWEGAIALANTWDPRVPLITDENYQDIIANEPLVGRQEEDRVWSLVISVPGRQEGLSQYVDEVFDAAFNTSLVLGDLPNVRWGRIDYLNVTQLTTKWNVWNAPYLVILKNRGKTLRFYQPRYLRLNEEAFRSFLINEDYKYTQPWTSSFAPGGKNEWIMDYIAFALAKVYETMILFPKWLMFVLSGSLASVIINYFHKSSPPPVRRQATQPAAEKKPSGEVQPKATGVALPQTSKRKKANAKESSH